MQGIPFRAIAGATVLLAGLAGVALAAQDRYTVKVPHGLGFAEFKGYETWQAARSARSRKARSSSRPTP